MGRLMPAPDRIDTAPAPGAADLPAARLALFAGIAVITVWGANFTVQKTLFGVLPPAAFLFARYLMMPACAALLLLYVNGGRWPRLPREDVLRLAWLGRAGALAARGHGHLRHSTGPRRFPAH